MKSRSRKMNPSPPSRNAALTVLLLTLLFACTYDRVVTEVNETPEMTIPMTVRIQECADRTGTQQINLGLQATTTFEEQFDAAEEFVVQQDGRYILYCEITSYLPGSAAKRWVMPGWGTTVGKVSSMLQDGQTGEILIIVEGEASVEAGGFYTIGAEQYIVPTAVRDVVGQLRAWVRGAVNN